MLFLCFTDREDGAVVPFVRHSHAVSLKHNACFWKAFSFRADRL